MPEIKIKESTFFITKDNIEKFKIVDFERKIYKEHLNRLKHSIQENGLLDKTITVFNVNGEYEILDGQHRFRAIEALINDGWKLSFGINLKEVQAENAEQARFFYLETNTGQRLTVNDILLAHSKKHTAFFEKLESVCSHYGNKSHLTYFNVLSALRYALTGGASVSIRRDDIEKTIESVEPYQIDLIVNFLESLKNSFGEFDVNHFIYKKNIFRNLLRIYLENVTKLQGSKWMNLLHKVDSSKYFREVAVVRDTETMKQVFERMQKLIR